jgi:hypothetical protein
MPKRRDSGSALRREQLPSQGAPERPALHNGTAVPPQSPMPQRAPAQVGSSAAARPTTGSPVNPSRPEPEPAGVSVRPGGPASVAGAPQPLRQSRPGGFDDEDLDVPDFLK